MGLGLAVLSIVNLVVLARTHRFDRYVVVVLIAGTVFTLGADILIGGLAGGAGIIWAFLAPAYALLALGPRRATPWFLVFLGTCRLRSRWIPSPPTSSRRPYAVQPVLLRPEHRRPAGDHVPPPALHRYPPSRRRGAFRRAPDERDPALDRDPPQARRGADRGVVSGDHGRSSPTSSASRRGPSGPTPPDVVSLLDDLFSRFDALRGRARSREDQDGRRRVHGGRRSARGAGPTTPRPPWRSGASRSMRWRRGGGQRPRARCPDRPRERAGRRRRHRPTPDPVRPLGRHREHRGPDGVVRRAGRIQLAASTRGAARPVNTARGTQRRRGQGLGR